MDIDAIITSANSYVREYLLYLIRQFRFAGDDAPAEHLADENGRLFVHTLLSVILGIYLQQKFIAHVMPVQADYLNFATRELCIWVMFALLLHVVVNCFIRPVAFVTALSAVLRVFPPVFAVSAFASYIGSALGFAFFSSDANCNGWMSYCGDVVAGWLLLFLVLPRALSQSTEPADAVIPRSRTIARVLVVTLLVLTKMATDLSIANWSLRANNSNILQALHSVAHSCF